MENEQGTETTQDEREEALPIRIRAGDERDTAFVYSSWLKSYSGQFKGIPRSVIYEYEGVKIKHLLESSLTLVAAGNTHSSAGDIYGYAVGQRTPGSLIIHYAYTKMPFRRWGISRALIDAFEYQPGELIIHSYKGYIAKDLKRAGYNLLYVPYLRDIGTLEGWDKFYESNKSNF